MVITGACSGDDGSKAVVNTITTTLTGPECDAVAAVIDAYDRLDSPQVFDLATGDVAHAFAARRDSLDVLAATLDDSELLQVLDDLHSDLEISDPPQEKALIGNHDVVAGIGMTWSFVVMTSTVVSGEEQAAYLRAREGAWPVRQIHTACFAPKLLEEPSQDLAPDIEGGTIVFDPVGAHDPGLLAVSSGGGKTTEIAPPSGWDDLDEPTAGPDGRTIVAVARRGGGSPSIGLAVGRLDGGFEVVYENPTANLACPRIDAQQRILVTELGQGGNPNTLLSVVNGTATRVELPVAEFYCAEQLREGTLLLGSATDDRQVYGGVALREGTDDDVPVYTPADCNNLITGSAPDGATELIVQTCDDVTKSGLYKLDIDSGEATQLAEGLAATARWSPSGEWITFGHSPSTGPSAETVRVWALKADGTGLRRITDTASSFPAWVSDELDS